MKLLAVSVTRRRGAPVSHRSLLPPRPLLLVLLVLLLLLVLLGLLVLVVHEVAPVL